MEHVSFRENLKGKEGETYFSSYSEKQVIFSIIVFCFWKRILFKFTCIILCIEFEILICCYLPL